MTPPTPAPLQVALKRYKTALNPLETSNISLNKEQILEILAARDALQKQLEAEAKISINMWSKLIEQDTRLKQKTYKITQVIDLAEYRESLPISEEAWWWYLDSRESLHPCNRFDWLFRVGKLVFLGVNFTLIGTIATRFFSGGSGLVEIGGFIFSTFISLLQVENALTKARSHGFVKIMNFFKIPEHWYEEIQFSVTFIIFGLLLSILLNFSFFSDVYNKEGKRFQDSHNLVLAEKNYLKAIELDGDNVDAHYKLGTLYEELQDINNAKKQYLIAAKAGYLDAYNNLAYWYIRENKNAEAVELLTTATNLLAEQDKQSDQLTTDKKRNLEVQKYSIYKNLGWARFKQNRYKDAIPNLLIAKNIADNKDYQPYIRNPGAAYCIYAQLLQKQDKQSSEAKENWLQCRQLIESRLAAGESINAEEDQWLYEAKRK
ncbi:tetratricopeptide repeat protein [Crocosphaera sp. XPORK-15E]|uniref:tetratricopeptide repeat protein n=1 Tax=Crocosphaera sp. XPORK-15E TaxID=3110247 RepID=UPI002B20EF03|nr:tetratricopeptide repeat protein [Crocosphaera sp. XPORK-15E]MEA5535850.1 tetratricopeptide repeat protein [Crocosphaera sp. XPORK-15E]